MYLLNIPSKSLQTNIIFLIYISLCITFLNCILLVANEIHPYINCSKTITILAVSGLIPFLISSSRQQFSPSRLFALSVLVFILARPIINIFVSVELVQIGDRITDTNLANTMLVLAISIWCSTIGYLTYFLYSCNKKPTSIRTNRVFVIPFSQALNRIIFILFLAFGTLFLVKSCKSANMLSSVDYFTAVSDPSFHAHLFLFFRAKLIGLLWVFSKRSPESVNVYAKYLFIFSLGFLIIGLRGYFMSYALIFLYFIFEKKRMNLFLGIILSGCFLWISSFVLEYRLGYTLYNNFGEMLISPFYSQGASFEVVFGATNFLEELHSVLPLSEYLTHRKSFGDYIDLVRGVTFTEGGFASSYYAEAYYFGLPFLIFLSFFLGIAISYLDRLSNKIFSSRDSFDVFRAKVILVSVLPNLVFFARSSAFDFLSKLLMFILILRILYRPSHQCHHSQASSHSTPIVVNQCSLKLINDMPLQSRWL